MVIAREGEDPEPGPNKDQRRLPFLVPKEVYCSSVSVDQGGVIHHGGRVWRGVEGIPVPKKLCHIMQCK